MYLIAKVKKLHNSYGIISFVQALVMSILLVEHLTLETVYIIHHRCYVTLAYSSGNLSVVDNSNQFSLGDNSFGIKVFDYLSRSIDS
uniref:Uncharacterized protein n=1 Tax=Acrobeloides nanus TaxID=290746 RepID=A0A914EJP5_9BILA